MPPNKLLEVLEDVIWQACYADDHFDSMALTAYADAIRLLAAYGRVVITKDVGRRVIAVPTAANAEEIRRHAANA